VQRRRLVFLTAAVFGAGLLVSPAASDPIPPAPPTITSSPSDPTKLTDASFEFTGETLIFECSLDGADFAACTSPQSYSALGEGARNFRVRAVSLDGPSEPASYSWYVDLTPPTLPGDLSAEATSAAGAVVAFAPTDDHELAAFNCDPAPGATFALGTTTVACTAEDAAGNSIAGGFAVTVEDTTAPTLDPHADQVAGQDYGEGAHVPFAPAVTAQDTVDSAPDVVCDHESGSAFPFGDTPVTCTATDDAGNTSEPLVFTVTVQTGPFPEAPVIDLKPPALTNSASAHFEFSTSGTLASVRCELDGGPSVDCTDSQDYADLTEGPHLFTVRVTNEIENVNLASYSWTVDVTTPGAVTSLRARARPGSVTLRWVLPIDGDFDRVRVKRRRAGAVAWKAVAEPNAASLTDQGLVNEVKYQYRVVSIDEAGNVSDRRFTTARPSRVFTPQYRATVRAPVLVDWTSVRKASYYNMQVWRHGRKILSVWPFRSRYRISSSWRFNGKRYFMNEGLHVVYVWPGFGPKAAARYGGLVGSTAFLRR
jgi:hypothetical protein